MDAIRTVEQEAAEDVFFGQIVLIWARWFLITGAAILLLLSAETEGQLTIATVFIVILMGVNFFVHGRYMLEKPANRLLLTIMSVLDILVVTGVVATWVNGDDVGGLESPYFIFYYPAVLAFAFVFQPKQSVIFTGFSVIAYAVIVIYSDPEIIKNSIYLERMVTRMITIAAVGGLATYYWRIQRERRRSILLEFSGIDELSV